MMTLPFGINLRVTANSNQGGRKYMEDTFAVAYQKTPDEKDLEFAYFGIFDGHGGREAAVYAQDHLLDNIADQKGFWSEDDNHVLKAIKDGFMITHRAMWKELGKWPKTVTGLPSTSGTTASIIFIRRGKLFIGHVGDSGIVLGLREPGSEHFTAMPLTKDHKPESPAERRRIEKLGGSVVSKSGVQRVVWNRPRLGHKGPVRRSTRIDQIPFLAVARSLGDLWSYNFYHGEFVVSPEPDVKVVEVDLKRFRCLILASDGLWNMLSPNDAVHLVEEVERREEQQIWEEAESNDNKTRKALNPSKILVKRALSMWNYQKMRADNTTVVTVMIDPQGPSRCEVLIRHRTMKRLRSRGSTDTSMYFLTDPNSVPSPQSVPNSETSELSHSHKVACKRSDTLKRKLSTFDSSTPSFESSPNDISKSSWKRRCCDPSSADPITRSPYNDGAVKLESSSEWQTNNNNPFCNNNNTFTFNNDLHVLSYPGSGIGKTLPPTPKISDCSNAEFGKVSCPRKILDDMCTNISMYSGINPSNEDSNNEKLENSCESCLDRQDCENNHLGNLEDSQNNNNGLKSFKLASNSRLGEDLCCTQTKCCVCDSMVPVHSGQKKVLASNPHQHENNCTSKLPSEDTRIPNSKERSEAGNILRNGRIPLSTDLKSLSKHQRQLNLLLKKKSVVKEISHSLSEQKNKCIESKNSPSSQCKAENNCTSDRNINLKHSKILKQSKLQTLSHIKNDNRRKACYERSCNLRKKGHA